jgi:hypothetical protein
MLFFHQGYDYTIRNQNKTVGINVARNAIMHLQSEGFLEVREKFSTKTSIEQLV